MQVPIKQLELFDDRVVIKQDPEPEKTASGLLYLPPSAKDDVESKPRTGVILILGYAANADRTDEAILKVGDSVLFGKYAGIELKELGDDYIIMRSPDIIGRYPRDKHEESGEEEPEVNTKAKDDFKYNPDLHG